MIDRDLIRAEFNQNGLSPHQISVKYSIDILAVYEILNPQTGDTTEESSF